MAKNVNNVSNVNNEEKTLKSLEKLEVANKIYESLIDEIIEIRKNMVKETGKGFTIDRAKSAEANRIAIDAVKEKTPESFDKATKARNEAIEDLLSKCKTKGIDLSGAKMAQDYLSKSSQSHKPQQTPGSGVKGVVQNGQMAK